jgi:NADPH-dependent 2,4-dienoyl-CoA reductase/sulfur reductase-like enzyme
MLEQAGVNCINVSAGNYSSMHRFIMPAYYPNGSFVHLAKGIKEAVKVPVIAVGAINDPLQAEDIIAGGSADMVAMGRALIADPYLPKKAFEGRFEDIRACIRCNDGCINRFFKGWTIRCAVNPVAGREKHYAEIPPARVRQKVMVIGGGPAGMQAAITARRRGHEVVLYEKSDRLGGLLNIATIPDFKKDLRRFKDHLINQVRQMKINVVYNREVNRQLVETERPDVVIIATGSRLYDPNVARINRGQMVSALDVYSGSIETGDHVLVVGAGLVGSETALILARQGKRVILMDRLEKIAFDVEPLTFMALTELLSQQGVEIRTGLNLEAAAEKGAWVSDKEWNRFTIEADTVVNALGLEPNQELIKELEGTAPVIFAVGDCYKPRDVGDCVHEAFSRAVGLEPGQDLSRDMGSAAAISFLGDDFYYEPGTLAGVSYGGDEQHIH